MNNELLLCISVVLIYGGTIAFFKFFDLEGLYVWTAIATILANIEVLILIDAFGMEQTLGNVMFASSFLVTDIVSENYGKKAAKKAVNIGIVTSIAFVVLSQIWIRYSPAENDFAMESIRTIFSNTPRLMIASLLVYAISQRLDVYLYHKWWDFTTARCKDRDRFLWVRNNGSTLISQMLNIALFNIGAFAGTFDISTLINITVSGYVIYIITSLLDTPFVYLSKFIGKKKTSKTEEI